MQRNLMKHLRYSIIYSVSNERTLETVVIFNFYQLCLAGQSQQLAPITLIPIMIDKYRYTEKLTIKLVTFHIATHRQARRVQGRGRGGGGQFSPAI